MRTVDLLRQIHVEYNWMTAVDKFRLTRWLDKVWQAAYEAGRRDERKIREAVEEWE